MPRALGLATRSGLVDAAPLTLMLFDFALARRFFLAG
jgi:hypothetical protein